MGQGLVMGGNNTPSGNATADELLLNATATTSAGLITGTMPNNGTVDITPGTSNQTIPLGYHNGSGLVYGSSNLTSPNIANGVNIFGVIGNFTGGQKFSYGTKASVLSGSYQMLTVSLTFQPRLILAYYVNMSDIILYDSINYGTTNYLSKGNAVSGSQTSVATNSGFVSSSGFSLSVPTSATYWWFAVS